VRNYLSGIFTKLEVTNRTEAVVLWLQHRGTSG
jgi:DNA-binding NarL/FixJ family response regulator